MFQTLQCHILFNNKKTGLHLKQKYSMKKKVQHLCNRHNLFSILQFLH